VSGNTNFPQQSYLIEGHVGGKPGRAPSGAYAGCSSPFLWLLSPQVNRPLEFMTHGQCDARPMVTFPAAEPFDQYQIIVLGEQRHICVNNLPKVVTWQCAGSESILGPFGHQSGPLLLHHQARLKTTESSSLLPDTSQVSLVMEEEANFTHH